MVAKGLQMFEVVSRCASIRTTRKLCPDRRRLGHNRKHIAVRADLSRLAPAQLQSAAIEDVSAGNSGQFCASRAMHR